MSTGTVRFQHGQLLDLSRSQRTLRNLSMAHRLRHETSHRRPPVPRRRHHKNPDHRAPAPTDCHRDGARPTTAAAPLETRARRHSIVRTMPRTSASSDRRPRSPASPLRDSDPSSRHGPPPPSRSLTRRHLLRPRGRPVLPRNRPGIPLRLHHTRRRRRASLRRRVGPDPRGREGGLRALRGFCNGALGAVPRSAHLPLRTL